MPSTTPVEIADRYSRKRAALVVIAALAFFIIHAIGRPFFYAERHVTLDWWAINAIALLLLLATGGGLLTPRQIRALVNDEVSGSNYRTAVVSGFWVAVIAAMVLYLLPRFDSLTAREGSYVVVTASTFVATLVFAFLELRAHRDA